MSETALAEFPYLENYTASIQGEPDDPYFMWDRGVRAMGPGDKENHGGTKVETHRFGRNPKTDRVTQLSFMLSALKAAEPLVDNLLNPDLLLFVKPDDDPAKVEELRQWLLTNLAKFKPA